MSFLEEKLPPTLPKTEVHGSQIQWNEISMTDDSADFLFTIRNYSHLNKKSKEYIDSSKFCMEKNKDIKWFLRFYPEGNKKDSQDAVSLYLYSDFKISNEIKANYYFAILGKNNENVEIKSTDVFKQNDNWGCDAFIKKNELIRRKSTLLPDDILTIFCSVTAYVNVKTKSKTIKIKKSMNEPQVSNKTELESNIYENCYLDNLFSDITIMVHNNELKAHKVFLAAASPVFASILKKDIKTNSITVTDIPFEVMRELLHFIYTKKVDNLHNIAHELIAAADKYRIQDLKIKCEESLCDSINIDNILKLLVIADEYDSKMLKKLAVECIIKNKQALKGNPDFKETFNKRPHLYELIFWSD